MVRCLDSYLHMLQMHLSGILRDVVEIRCPKLHGFGETYLTDQED